jgi:hypothetical protein
MGTVWMVWLFACNGPEVPQQTPEEAADQVAMALTSAAVSGGRGELEHALATWEDAHERFELQLEAPLRAHCGVNCVAEIEFGFGRFRRLLVAEDESGAAADALSVRLQEVTRSLPVPVWVP